MEDRGGAWWDEFFEDRSKPFPFFVEWPDENLVAWFGAGLLTPGRVLELGCGPGRNAIYLVELVHRALKPGGSFGLVCFRPEGGSDYTDQQAYEQGSLGGGLGYSEDRLRARWDKPPFSARVLRQMNKSGEAGPYFGEDFLWALLAAKEPARW
jgi:hypothetical protein